MAGLGGASGKPVGRAHPSLWLLSCQDFDSGMVTAAISHLKPQ
jgi:hypothetical protein